MKPILGKDLSEIEAFIFDYHGNKRHAATLCNAIYRKRIQHIHDIKSIPLTLRKAITTDYFIGNYLFNRVEESTDGTNKYLFINERGYDFETAYLPGTKRNTLCISTQSGCRMGCEFCKTGQLGLKGSLSAFDMLNQLYSIPQSNEVNRLVLMGMGEPFDNFTEVTRALRILTSQWGFAFGKSNITISTVGILNPLRGFLQNPLCNLAISLNSPFPVERIQLMPIERSNPISEVASLVRLNPLPEPLRVSFEYVALGGMNLTRHHARAISVLLRGIRCHLNIINWNHHPTSRFKLPANNEVSKFIEHLNHFGVLASVRESRGQDIGAACGTMVGKG